MAVKITNKIIEKSAEEFAHKGDKAARFLAGTAVLAGAAGQPEIAIPAASAAAILEIPRAAEVVGKGLESAVRDLRHHRWNSFYHDLSRIGKRSSHLATVPGKV